MKPDRELIALSKTKALEALADHFQLPHAAILTKARNLGFRSGGGRNENEARPTTPRSTVNTRR